MKTRNGFVSNSSTSSFVCTVCGTVEGYSDCIGAEDMGISACEHGHEFCHEHLLPIGDNDEHGSEYYEVPSSRCPICTMTAIDAYEEVMFLRKVLGWKEGEVLEQVKIRCKDYDEFQAFIKVDA